MPNIEEPRRSKCQRVPKSFGLDFLAFLLENEPQTFKEAMKSSEVNIGNKQSIVKLNPY